MFVNPDSQLNIFNKDNFNGIDKLGIISMKERMNNMKSMKET